MKRVRPADLGFAILFAPAPGEFYEDDLNDALELVFKYNVRWLRRRQNAGLNPTRILECSLRYIPEENIGDGLEIQWWPHYWCLRQGGMDCKAAAAALAAEMVVYDGDANARPFGTLIDDGPRLRRFHARVKDGNGNVHDPSQLLEGNYGGRN